MNIRRLFVNLQTEHDNLGQRVVASLDTRKAFDSVEWDYLFGLLEIMGFGPTFISWVKLLYTEPLIRVRVNGIISEPFPVLRGTRQGCPLSPLLFSLAIEPLATKLRDNPRMTGLRVGGIEERVSLYVDDMLLYLQDPEASLSTAFQLIQEFRDYSGF